MKYIFIVFLMCFFVSAQAMQNQHKLHVEMINYGIDNCILINSEVLHGKIITGSIPPYLPNTGLKYNFKIGLPSVSSHKAAYTDAELKLTYKCGENKHFTIYMKQYYKKNHYHGQMSVMMVDSMDVNESHEVSAPERSMGNHNNPKSGYIRWVFWN